MVLRSLQLLTLRTFARFHNIDLPALKEKLKLSRRGFFWFLDVGMGSEAAQKGERGTGGDLLR